MSKGSLSISFFLSFQIRHWNAPIFNSPLCGWERGGSFHFINNRTIICASILCEDGHVRWVVLTNEEEKKSKHSFSWSVNNSFNESKARVCVCVWMGAPIWPGHSVGHILFYYGQLPEKCIRMPPPPTPPRRPSRQSHHGELKRMS